MAPFQGAEKFEACRILSFGGGPALNFIEIDLMCHGHCHRLVERLAVPPVVESRESIHYALRRRQNLYAQWTDGTTGPLTNQFTPDRQRPGRKLERERV